MTGQCVGLGGDKLSLWSHPKEISVAYRDGGWTADAIAEVWSSVGRRAARDLRHPVPRRHNLIRAPRRSVLGRGRRRFRDGDVMPSRAGAASPLSAGVTDDHRDEVVEDGDTRAGSARSTRPMPGFTLKYDGRVEPGDAAAGACCDLREEHVAHVQLVEERASAMEPAPKITAANARLRPRATPKRPGDGAEQGQPDGDQARGSASSCGPMFTCAASRARDRGAGVARRRERCDRRILAEDERPPGVAHDVHAVERVEAVVDRRRVCAADAPPFRQRLQPGLGRVRVA